MLDKTTEETTEVVTSFKALIGKVERGLIAIMLIAFIVSKP